MELDDDLSEFNRFEVQNGSIVVLRGEPDDAAIQKIASTSRCQLVINRALGFSGSDLEFLRGVGAKVVSLEVVGDFLDDSGVVYCPNLEELNLNTSCASDIDWTKFSRLKHLFVYSDRIGQAIGALDHLNTLHVDGVRENEVSALSGLRHLTELRLTSPRLTSLDFAAGVKFLRKLRLSGATRIADFGPIGQLEAVQDLSINECKRMSDIKFASQLSQIRQLDIGDNGRVASLGPLAKCSNLDELLFYGSTNIVDGDLGVLGTLPNLTTAAYQVRRHYKNAPKRFPTLD